MAVVNQDWTVAEITAHYPETAEVFAEWGIHCAGCSVGGMETLAEAGALHGFLEDDLERLVDDLNDAIAAKPAKPEALRVTKAAALRIRTIAEKENVAGQILSVRADADGGFFMEFREKPEPAEKIFWNDEVDEAKVCASPLTLRRIGGATIDCREGRFKLVISDPCGCAQTECCCRDSDSAIPSQ